MGEDADDTETPEAAVELADAMSTTGTCRYYRPDPVPDDVLRRAVELARFAPQGGNRQGVRFLVVREAETKRQLADLYLRHWRPYAERVAAARPERAGTLAAANEFAEALHAVPAIVVVCAELAALYATDLETGRLSIVGGASVYPMVQNFCLACRDQGVATALTTLLCHEEAAVKALLGIPDGFVTAAHLAVGYPARPFPARLNRRPAAELVFAESFGRPLGGP